VQWSAVRPAVACGFQTYRTWQCGIAVPTTNEVTVRRAQLVLGWVIIFGGPNHHSISQSHPGQFSLLPSVGREISTSQSAVTLQLGSKGRYGSFHVWI